MDFERVDMRKITPEESDKAREMAQTVFKLNHTMPYTQDYDNLLKELFGENIGENSNVMAPVAGAAFDRVKIGNDRQILTCKPIHIKKGAWIGAGASILPGVTVGRYSIVGAGAVVTKNVPDYAVVVGCPAKVVKTLDEDKFNQN